MAQIQNILLCLLFFSVNFGMWEPFGSGEILSVAKIAGILYLGAVVLTPKGFFVLPRGFRPIFIPLVLFVLFLTLMNLLNLNPDGVRWFNAGMFEWTLMMLVLVNHERMRPLSLTRGMLAFGVGALAMSLLAWWGVGTEFSPDGRKSIFGENENAIAIRMAVGTAVMLWHATYNPLRYGRWRWILTACTLPMVALLVGTGSRVGMIALTAMLLGLMFGLRGRNRLWGLSRKVIAAAALGFALYYAHISDTMSLRFEQAAELGDLSGRVEIWRSVIPLIGENPVVGVGETGYAAYSLRVFSTVRNPHNVILELMCYTGAVGTLLYLWFFLAMARGAFAMRRRTGDLLPLLLFIPLTGLLLSGQAINVKTVWCVYAYISGTYVSQASLPLKPHAL